jgi:hypothetical protein
VATGGKQMEVTNVSKICDFDWGAYNNFKLVALYKTFSGEEFVEVSLASIYRFCHKIVFVHSETSWSGEKGNTVAPDVEAWKKEHDSENKIVNLYVNMRSQDEQYKHGFDYIKSSIPCDFVMLIDTDEVWDDEVLQEAIFRIFLDKENNAFSTRLHTYIKSPLYKVEPMEWCKPTYFVRSTEDRIKGPRGINNSPKRLFNDIQAHHFTYVRKDEETVMKKITTSFIGDGPGTHCVPLEEWIREKWNKLPFATDFHTTKTAETSWHSIKTISIEELPTAVKNNTKLLNLLLPFGHLTNKDQELLFQYAKGAELAVDLGTYLGRSAITMSLNAKKVVTIDLFEDMAITDDEELKLAYEYYGKNKVIYNNTFEDVKKGIWPYSNVEVRKAVTSKEAVNFSDNSIDTLFIDADHSYNGVKRDFEAWISKVKVGGIILFHDYNDLFVDVISFVTNEVLSRNDIEFVEKEIPTIVVRKTR